MSEPRRPYDTDYNLSRSVQRLAEVAGGFMELIAEQRGHLVRAASRSTPNGTQCPYDRGAILMFRYYQRQFNRCQKFPPDALLAMSYQRIKSKKMLTKRKH